MVNINKKTLKFYVYGTFFYCFIGIQDNLANYINNDIKNKENKNKVIKKAASELPETALYIGLKTYN